MVSIRWFTNPSSAIAAIFSAMKAEKSSEPITDAIVRTADGRMAVHHGRGAQGSL